MFRANAIDWYIIQINNRKFLLFQSKFVGKFPNAESNRRYSPPSKYRKVAQCGAKSNRFQSQAVNRVFRRIAAGTMKVDGKKHLKTIGRVGASSERMSLLTPTVLFFLHGKFEAKELWQDEKLQVFANGPRRQNQSFVDGRPSPFVQSRRTFCQSRQCSLFISILTWNSKEIRWRTSMVQIFSRVSARMRVDLLRLTYSITVQNKSQTHRNLI